MAPINTHDYAAGGSYLSARCISIIKQLGESLSQCFTIQLQRREYPVKGPMGENILIYKV